MDYKNIATPPPKGWGFFRSRTPTPAQDLRRALKQPVKAGEPTTIKGDFKSFDTKAAQKACGNEESSRITPEGRIDYSGIRFEGAFRLEALTALIKSSVPGTLDLTGIRFDPKERLTQADFQSFRDLCVDHKTSGALTGANVSGADLSNRRVVGDMFKKGNLSGANLEGTVLTANLSGANLRGANLSGLKEGSVVTLDCAALSSYLRGLKPCDQTRSLDFDFNFKFDSTVPVTQKEFKAMVALAKEKNVCIPLNGMNLAGLDLHDAQIDTAHTAFTSLSSLATLPDKVASEEKPLTIRFDPPGIPTPNDLAALETICVQKGITRFGVPKSKMEEEPRYQPLPSERRHFYP